MAGNITGYGGPRLFVSSDQGINWTISGSGLPVNVHRIFCLEEYNGMLIAGTDNGVFYTDDIDSGWNHVTGIYYPNVYAMLKVGNRLYCGTNHGLYYTDEITSDLQLCQNGMAGDEYITSLAQVNGHLFAGCHWGDGVFLLRNFENHFVHLTGLLNPQVLRLCIDDNYVYAGTYAEEYSLLGGVYRQELSTIVATKEVNPPVPFRLLGNPVTDLLNVDFDEQVREGILTIYYPDGREIRNCKILNGSAEVNMRGLSSGLYLGQVFCNEKYFPFKFIKI
ncbi:MAG: T9SS type A sorting domain-containing protein [Bacteroidales bacterium]|nr:T9SS type A sorting domain-containing protein [Bacteroidales bacterium]